MWVFLAQECLFFGALFLSWIYCRYWNIAGFDAGSADAQLWIGSINTGILVTSSFATRWRWRASRAAANAA